MGKPNFNFFFGQIFQIPREGIEANQGALEEFSLNIIEDGTMFAEKVAIDVEKDLEYFNVPPHNKVTEAVDYLYDFRGVSLQVI